MKQFGVTKFLRKSIRMLYGLVLYIVSKKTPEKSYFAMRELAGMTDGRLNRAWLVVTRLLYPKPAYEPGVGVLGLHTAEEVSEIVNQIERNGYCVLEQKLPDPICDALEKYARETPCFPRGGGEAVLFDPEVAKALCYDFSEISMYDCKALRDFVFDPLFASISSAYLGCKPIYDFSRMWWSTSTGTKDYSGAAQMFHYDMDRPAFLKFFVYLTDVTSENGPHVFVAGSHRSKPKEVRRPKRYTDKEIEAAYSVKDIHELCGPRGTIFIADTSGYHKGLALEKGARLILQAQYSNTLFGQNYPRPDFATLGIERNTSYRF